MLSGRVGILACSWIAAVALVLFALSIREACKAFNSAPTVVSRQPPELSKEERAAVAIYEKLQPMVVVLRIMKRDAFDAALAEVGQPKEAIPNISGLSLPWRNPCEILLPDDIGIAAHPAEGYAYFAERPETGTVAYPATNIANTFAHELLHCARGSWHPSWVHIAQAKHDRDNAKPHFSSDMFAGSEAKYCAVFSLVSGGPLADTPGEASFLPDGRWYVSSREFLVQASTVPASGGKAILNAYDNGWLKLVDHKPSCAESQPK